MVPSCVARGIVVAKAKVGARTGMGKAVLADRGSLSSRYCTRKVISSSGSIFTIILARKLRRFPCDCIRFSFDLQFLYFSFLFFHNFSHIFHFDCCFWLLLL